MIRTINIDQFIRENKLQGPIESDQLYFGRSMNFHPQGLYSEDIFGVEGTSDRREVMSYIKLNCSVIHPQIYDILQKRIFRKIQLLISGEKTFSIDDNGFLIEDEDGMLDGLESFKQNIDKINFAENKEFDERSKIIIMLKENIKNGNFFIDKIPVVSPDIRPIQIDEITGDVQVDELTKIYQGVIRKSNQLLSVSGILHNALSYRMQLLVRDIFEHVKTKISKKNGMIRSLMLGKRTDYSGRAVITPNAFLTIGYAGIPFTMACQLFEPFLIYAILNGPDKDKIPPEFHIAVKQFLDKETYIND